MKYEQISTRPNKLRLGAEIGFLRKYTTLILVQEKYISPSVLGFKTPDSEGVLSELHNDKLLISERKKPCQKKSSK